ncbi:zinc-binding alcohol dehydrogenase family protein [Pasteurellaceae bacterium HPA106]|uniref:zinc-binding alcohol dehydrogenase family protein n=1 Tax=Spirabiliibacterium pneumoniae TaxID=221400 RepID=UPI001AADB22D|nr:zinc-binding alcohol dehydrogenase family protein [Spirabiliibacterium pneumoniae]MBE2895970.1 zinc-binding alcohol dehydrogenase family protein [Spirabiliibacterium pneumoniae]
MHAIGFNQPLPITHKDALLDIEAPMPELGEFDILVEIYAVSVNPADVKIRASHTPSAGKYRILGYDAAGRVIKCGSRVNNLRVGDEVYYAGAINRPGAYAQFHAVDARLVAKKPKNLTFAQAAALPLTTLTAWEVLFERLRINEKLPDGDRTLLLIGGAGGVGSITIQLVKALSDVKIIATASRQESADWVRKLGADEVINHHHDLVTQLSALKQIPQFVFSTNESAHYLPQIAQLIAPQGRFALIDDPDVLDINPLKDKSVSVHWEFMFTRSLYQTADIAIQGEILQKMAQLIEKGKIQTTLTTTLSGLNAETLKQAHRMVEQGDMIGKVVVTK